MFINDIAFCFTLLLNKMFITSPTLIAHTEFTKKKLLLIIKNEYKYKIIHLQRGIFGIQNKLYIQCDESKNHFCQSNAFSISKEIHKISKRYRIQIHFYSKLKKIIIVTNPLLALIFSFIIYMFNFTLFPFCPRSYCFNL